MNLFETVKNSVTVKQAAERYGCKVNRGRDDLLPPSTMTATPA